jgi:ActR/RegA family two-component response regulator
MLSSVAEQPAIKDSAIMAGACQVLAKPTKPDSIIAILSTVFS